MRYPRSDSPEPTQPSAPPQPDNDVGTGYRTPEIVPLGPAIELMQRNIWGHLLDGEGGWWVSWS